MSPVLKIILIVIGVLANLWLGFIFIPSLVVFYRFFKRQKKQKSAENFYAESTYYRPFRDVIKDESDFIVSLPHEELVLENGERPGENAKKLKLCATLYGGGRDRIAVLMHGYGSEPIFCMSSWAKFLYDKGFSLLIPDQRCIMRSEGRFSTLGVAEGRDTSAWARLISEKYPNAQLLLCGVSMGGGSVLFASDRVGDCRTGAIIADCPVSSPYEQMLSVSRSMHFPDWLMVPTVSLIAKLKTGEDFRESAASHLEKSRIPVFFISGTGDTTVNYRSVEKLYAVAPAGSVLRLVEGAEHAVAFRADREKAELAVTEFLNKYYGEKK